MLTHLARGSPPGPRYCTNAGPATPSRNWKRRPASIARGLIARGVQPGERVVVWATNVPEWVVLQFALAKIGAILVTANTLLRARDIDYLLRQCEASTLVTIRGFRDLDYLAALDQIGATRGRFPTLERLILIDRGDEAVPPASSPTARFATMRPRCPTKRSMPAAQRSARRRDQHAVHVRHDRVSKRRDAVEPEHRQQRRRARPDTGLYAGRSAVPVRAALSLLRLRDRRARCYTHGAALCPIESFDPLRVLATVDRERCTALYGVPTMFLAELEHPEFARFDLTSLRTGVMAGALCPEPLLRRVMSEMHLPEITIAYGLTESSPAITQTPRDSSVEDRSQTVGVVLPDLDVKVIDPCTGALRATGERGELCVRGYNVMQGYYNNPEATRAAIDDDGWLRSGDEATIDDRGFVRITGRIKDLIIRGGENISPKEIEDCLREHPGVADAYVYGLPDDFFGEIVAAAVRLRHPPPASGREGRANST